MAVYFCDSSAIVKCYVYETGSTWIAAMVDATAGHRIYIARITGVEVISAITRRARHSDIAASDVAAILGQFRRDFTAVYHAIEVTPTLVARAMVLAETHALRGYDAVQLAAALEVHDRILVLGLPPLTLVSADGELNMAAMHEGLPVEDPNVH